MTPLLVAEQPDHCSTPASSSDPFDGNLTKAAFHCILAVGHGDLPAYGSRPYKPIA